MQGFIIFDYASKFNEARKELAQWLSEGKIKRKETIIKGGLGIADQALIDLYKGINTGMRSLRKFLDFMLYEDRSYAKIMGQANC